MTELQRLQLLDVSVSRAVRNGLTAVATKHYVNWQFFGLPSKVREQVYRTHPANNFLYQANEAVIEGSIVKLLEQIKAEDRRQKLPFNIPVLADLRRHRIVISHPGTTLFGESEVQHFFDNREQYRDGKKALRFLRTREALTSKIVELGGEIRFPTSVCPQLGTAELVHGVLSVALRSRSSAPNIAEIRKSVSNYFGAYEKSLRASVAAPKIQS